MNLYKEIDRDRPVVKIMRSLQDHRAVEFNLPAQVAEVISNAHYDVTWSNDQATILRAVIKVATEQLVIFEHLHSLANEHDALEREHTSLKYVSYDPDLEKRQEAKDRRREISTRLREIGIQNCYFDDRLALRLFDDEPSEL